MNGSREDGPALEISHLVKRYGDFTAVDDVSLEIARGDFFAFLGPNGAGKTTTINAVVGLATITSGTISIFGYDTEHAWRKARSLVGLAPQEYNFDRYLSIRDILIFQAGYYGLRGRAIRARADALLERFGLTSKANETFMRLSGGMKRRLSLARALIHEPRLLILDEPTAGVDVELRIELWDLLRELNASGTTIVLTTHYLEEAEELCRNVAIIESGKILARESTQKLVSARGQTSLAVRVRDDLERVPTDVAGHDVSYDRSKRSLSFDRVAPDAIAPILVALEAAGIGVDDVDVRRSSLQDVFLELVGK